MNRRRYCQTCLAVLDAETFESTVFWKQNQTAWDLYVEDGLKHCLKVSKTGESVDGVQALQVLEERRGKAEQKKKKEEDALEERIRKRQTEAEYVRREAGRLQAQCNALRVGAQKEEDEEDWREEGFTETGKNLDPDASAAGWCTRAAGSTFAAESSSCVFSLEFSEEHFYCCFSRSGVFCWEKVPMEKRKGTIFRSGKSN